MRKVGCGFVAVVFAATSSVCITGCSDGQLQEDISKFNTAVQSAKGAVNTFYQNLNDFQRTLYVTELRLTPGKPPEVLDTKTKLPTGLFKYYSSDEIEARVKSFEALSTYTAGLAMLAASKSDEDAEAAIKATGDKVSTLATDLSNLSGTKKPPEIQKFATPVAQLAGLITKDIMAYVKNRALKDSLSKSKTQVDLLCSVFKADIRSKANLVKQTGSARIFKMYRDRYVSTQSLIGGSVTDGSRIGYLHDMEAAAKQTADCTGQSPLDLVSNVQDIHNQIITYLEGGKTDDSTRKNMASTLETDLSNFSSQASGLEKQLDDVQKELKQQRH